MKRLYVGCRVRIKWSRGWPELAGQQGVIVGRRDQPAAGGGWCEWDVAPDCWGTNWAPYLSHTGGAIFSPTSDQLEPIQDPGHEVISWEEMRGLWTPSEVTA